MSSTNRGGTRNEADFYKTPLKPIKDFLEVFIEDENIELSKQSILDPSAGGVICKDVMPYPQILWELGGINITSYDIREDSPAQTITDFLEIKSFPVYDLIITNPPFGLAQQFIEKSLEMCIEGGYVIMLLRLNYLGSKKRKDFWEKNMPTRIYVHNKRMSFTDNNKTDSIEYAHFVFQKGENPKESKLKIINGF